MQVAERLQDAKLADQIYQWSIKGDLSSIYADYTGDVLWKLNRKIQARYYWQSAYDSDYLDDEFKSKIFEKLLKGL